MRVFCFRAFLLALLSLGAACGPPAFGVRPYPEPTGADVVTYLTTLRTRVATLKAETRTDAFVGKDRVNVEVDILAKWGGKLRYQAMNPAGSAMAADLASDGLQICFIDANHNCGACGPATPENVGQLVRVAMPPDEVVATMFGSTPLIDAVKSHVEWNAQYGQEELTLTGQDGAVQRIILDGRDHHWDVITSELRDAKGKVIWRIDHKEFHAVKGADGVTVRLPGKSRFIQGANNVLIDWRQQIVNEPQDDAKFQITLEPGLPVCK